MTTGIYKIENKVNGHAYVGQSINIEKRWKAHKESAFTETSACYDYPLSRAFRKYGIDNFSFEVQEECEISELNDHERFYIWKYDTFFHGYNQTMGGDSGVGGCPKEHVIGIIHDLETTNMQHREIAAKWNVSTEMVQGINTGRYWKYDRVYPIQNRYGYIARVNRKQRLDNEHKCIECGKPISYGSSRCRICDNKHRTTEKPIGREELKKLIRNTPFIKIGEMFQVTDNAIRKWCKRYGLPMKKSLIQKYTDEEWALV